MQTNIIEAKEIFASLLADESPRSADRLADMSMDALTEPIVGTDGRKVKSDTRRQQPEAQAGDQSADGSSSIDILTLSDRKDLKRLE